MEKEYKWMVHVDCMTYNHASYIEDALNGFCMQETDFPFVCTIIDDASTDGEQEVIKRYLEEHFDLENKTILRNEETEDYVLTFARHKTNTNCYFAVLYLKYNHYSIKKDKMPYIAEWQENCKYIALCEGDDYWIDGKKLQKQYELLEKQTNYSLCFHANYILYPSGEQKVYKPSIKRRYYTPEDTILGGGNFIATCSMFYRNDYLLKERLPSFWGNCPVGDLPCMLYLASKGLVGYLDEIMSVYRYMSVGSWSSKLNNLNKMTEHHKAILKMFDEYDLYTNFKYHKTIKKKKKINNITYLKMIIRHLLHV